MKTNQVGVFHTHQKTNRGMFIPTYPHGNDCLSKKWNPLDSVSTTKVAFLFSKGSVGRWWVWEKECQRGKIKKTYALGFDDLVASM
eukprot:scaffold674_cov130-Amphora_coffeaeformis.AAC.5